MNFAPLAILLRIALVLCLVGCTDKLKPVDTGDVNFDDVVGILITPEKIILPLGESVQLEATGLTEDRESRDLTHYVTWVSDSGSVAQVSNSLDAEGVVTGEGIGSTRVRASLGDVISIDVDVEVTEAELVGLAVEPKNITVQEGQTVQLKAMAVFSDGKRSDAAAQVRWLTADGSVAQLESGGSLTGKTAGSTEVHVVWGEVTSEPADVVVKKQAPADLVISEVHGESSDTLLSVTVAVTNEGDVGASDFFLDVFIDAPGTPAIGDYGDDWILVSYLGPGEVIKHTFTFELSRGEHSVQVLADSLDSVTETNENNNSFATTITVGSGPSGPNLSFDRFEYIADSESVYYAIDVLNTGSESVSAFYVDLFLDSFTQPPLFSDGDKYVDVDGLAPGETHYADFFLDESCSYCYTWIVVDSYDEIDETDESDNVAGPLYVVPGG